MGRFARAALYFGLRNNLPNSWDVLLVSSAGCVPVSSVKDDSNSDYCQRSNWFALKTIRETHPNVVIVAQRNRHRFDELMKIGNLLKNEGIEKVIFNGPVPQWIQDLPKIVTRRLWNDTPERTFDGIDDYILTVNKNLKAKFSMQDDFVFVDLVDFFCNPAGCLTRIGPDKKEGITSWDYGHLTPIASDYLAKNLLAKIVAGGEERSMGSE